MTVAFFISIWAPSAQAYPCQFGQGNYFVDARPTDPIRYGVGGTMNVRTNIHLENGGGMHVESLYVVMKADYWLEMGWYLYRPASSTGDPTIFSARHYWTDYKLNNLENPSLGNHRIWQRHSPGDNRYHFYRDGYHYPFKRRPAFKGGLSAAFGEIHNQCDDGRTHWWDLQSRTYAGNWLNWAGTNWRCDLEKGFGYTGISNIQFRIDPRSDEFTGCRR